MAFNQVRVTATGAQVFKDRFPNDDPHDANVPGCYTSSNDFKTPCNVTGLSHVYNLYFVAYIDAIHVYEPQFPCQRLTQDPVLIILTTDKQSQSLEDDRIYRQYRTRGTRAINRLLVQLLGNQEVVAITRDDGHVEAYYTRHIYHAIGNHHGLDIKPFFHRNVGLSAWGLAIHSSARMIAVTSNTHATTVFTFALTDDHQDDHGQSSERDEVFYYSINDTRPPNDRRKNDVRVLCHVKAMHNLPDVAFCNTGNDPAGRWLLTADILGQVAAWDVHTMSLVQLVNTALSVPIFPIPSGWMDPRNAVWGLMFLDPLSFRTTMTLQEAFGIVSDEAQVDLDKDKANAIWDIGKAVDQIHRVRRPFKDFGKAVEVNDGNYADPLEMSRRVATSDTSKHTDNSPDADSDQDDNRIDSDDQDEYDSGAETHVTYRMPDGKFVRKEKPKPSARFRGPEGICRNLPCPILQLSFKDIYLYQPTPNNCAWEHFPIPAIRRLFQQEVPAIFETSKFGRINMYAQLPSLGVVIVATQKGRVAILSLTQTLTQVPDYASAQNKQYSRPPLKRRIYAMRVDHVLPLASQEEAGHRPKAGIHGIAVGPVQGTEHLADELKRWRLIVHYQNHAMLSYEIGRRSMGSLSLNLLAM